MDIKIGDHVTRNSYNNDMIFVVTDIVDNLAILKGLHIRLCADSTLDDLQKVESDDTQEEREFLSKIQIVNNLSRDDYFYLPGKILHIDGDIDYLNRCLQYYKDNNIWAIGKKLEEKEIAPQIYSLLEEYRPTILVITGHDAYYKKQGNQDDLNAYKNSIYFIEAVKEARRYEKSHEKLLIIAGACQSDYEDLIKAGATFASSPKRINIHALDPALVATKLSLTEATSQVDLKGILEITKYGSDGIGGIITKGTMYVGYPR